MAKNIIKIKGSRRWQGDIDGGDQLFKESVYVCPAGKIAKIIFTPFEIGEPANNWAFRTDFDINNSAISDDFPASYDIAINGCITQYCGVGITVANKVILSNYGSDTIPVAIGKSVSATATSIETDTSLVNVGVGTSHGFIQVPMLLVGEKVEIQSYIFGTGSDRWSEIKYDFMIIEEDI